MSGKTWSEPKRFALEFVRSIGVVATAGVVSVFVIGHFEEIRNMEEYKWKRSFSDLVKIRDDFVAAHYQFSGGAYNAFSELGKDQDKRDENLEKIWQRSHTQDMFVALERIQLLEKHEKLRTAVKTAKENLIDLYSIYTAPRERSRARSEEQWRSKIRHFTDVSTALAQAVHADIYEDMPQP